MNSIYAMEEESLNKYLSVYDNGFLHEAVNKYSGKIEYNAYDISYHGSAGIIHISGIISRNQDMLANFLGYGSASIENIAKDFQKLIDNEDVKSIILDFDTPGGTITGVNELAEIIYNARGIKPIKAYVTGMACSAGYFLASACDEIIIDEMGQVGSIGVMRVVQKKDNKTIIFKSSQSPMKNVEPESELGKAEYQSKVDYLASIFIDKVAKYRNITADEVIKRGNHGSVLVGNIAVTAGLADRIGSMDSLINELNNWKGNSEAVPLSNTPSFQGQSLNLCESSTAEKINYNKEINMPEKKEEKIIDTAEIEASAVEKERKRVADIMAIKVPHCEGIINDAVKSGATLEETNARIVAYIQSEEYNKLIKSEKRQSESLSVEPVVAGADIPDMSKEDMQVSAMLNLAEQFNKAIR